jgi:hypothetical protein
MDSSDLEVKRLFELEGLTHWMDARLDGYAPLVAAVDALGFYDERGGILRKEYAY